MTDKASDPIDQVEAQSAPTGGTFTLSGNGHTTAPIAFNASAAAVQAVLQSLWDDRGDNAMTHLVMKWGKDGKGSEMFRGPWLDCVSFRDNHKDKFCLQICRFVGDYGMPVHSLGYTPGDGEETER